MAKKNPIKAVKDFWYGKPHTAEEGGRRLGDLYEDKTGLLKHREWRGVKDTFYYMYNIWGYNYVHMVLDILKFSNNPIDFFKGTWRYRWMGQTYLPVIHWFERGLQGMRGEALAASAWHYRAMVSASIHQICNFFNADTRLHGGKQNEAYKHTIYANETTCGTLFYPWKDAGYQYLPMEMIPYFVTCHVNSHTVLNYIDAVQSIGLPGDPCPMCQAESGLFVLDDVPDSAPIIITCNEACDASVSTHTLQDWFANKPLFALPIPMQFDDPLVKKYCMNEIEEMWKFIEEQTGVPFSWESMKKYLERQNKLQRDEWEKWDVASKTDYYPINGVAQALFRIYSTQYGIQTDCWEEASEKVKKIMYKCVEKKINPFPQTRHRVIAADAPPRDRLVLRAAVFLQLVHLGLQLLGPEHHHQHGLADVRHGDPHRLLRQHARGHGHLPHVGADAPHGCRRHAPHLRAVGLHEALQLRHGRDVRPAPVQGHAGRARPVRGRVPQEKHQRLLDPACAA